jgi:hypothetical protein
MNTTERITLETTVTQHPELMSQAMGKETVMMVLEKSAYFSLDEIGSEIWRLIATPIPVTQLCERLLDRFEVTPEQCQADVLLFLNEIHEQGLVQRVSGGKEPSPE